MVSEEILASSILIVDDNVANVELVREMLSHQGYKRIVGENDPRNVVPLCTREKFDILLLDIRMPHLSGFDLMEKLRPLFGDEYIPILVLTAQADQETRRRALRAGATDFLTKPFVAWELLQRVHNMLQIRHLYKQVRSQNRELEQRVAERTQKLSEALEASRKADRAKSDFLAVMSHELRTPLNAIIGFAEVLVTQPHGPLHEEYLEYVNLIERSGRQLLVMVNRILEFTQGATGILALEETIVDLPLLLRFCITLHGPKAHAKQVALRYEDGAALHVRADERRLRDAVMSVLDNAIKFNRHGGDVTVAIERFPESVAVTIRDTGPGIDPALMARLFDPFFQADDALARRHDGIGLGLSIVQRFVELHGGHVHLASEPGQGTAVTLHLPNDRVIGG